MKKIFACFLILQSLSFLTVGLYQLYLHEEPAQLSFSNYYIRPSIAFSEKDAPINIAIPSLNINLPIYQAKVVNHVWPTTDIGASYLTTSPLPGEIGNSIIYAHDWTSLFGHLVNARTGDKVVITYPDHKKKTFVIEYTSVVSPTESSILAPSNDKRITLYTCTGLFDSKRFVAVAILKS